MSRNRIRPLAPVGEQFGMWTVISSQVRSSDSRHLYWKVQCKCGTIAFRSPHTLKNGTSTRCKSCGNKSYFTDSGEVNIQALIISKFNQTVNALKDRKKLQDFTFNITPEYLNQIYNNNKQCKLSGVNIELDLTKSLQKQNLSIDRIDSNKGYEIGNIQLVDKRINMMKGTLSNEEFIYLCKQVTSYNQDNG